jgi:ketosteroid isomerase-like protein
MVFECQSSPAPYKWRGLYPWSLQNRIEANAFATNWIRAWNKKDVDAVLKHYVEDARFISPKAATFVGNPVIEGKKALSEYWYLAAKKIEKIEFKLDHIVWDSNELIFSMRRISTEFAAVPVNQ